MPKISKLTIKGFRSIKNLEDFHISKGLNVMIGANGAGKSNFIGYFRFLNSIINQRLQTTTKKFGGANKILHNGSKVTKSFSSKAYFDLNGYIFNLEPTQSGGFVFESEELFFDGPFFGKSTYSLGSGHDETKLFSIKDPTKKKVSQYVTRALQSWTVYHFHDTSETAGVKQPCDINNNIKLETDAANLAAFLFRLQEKEKSSYQGIRRAVQMIAPFFHDFILRPDPLSQGMIQLEWKSKSGDQPFTAHQLSDGTIRFICLATVLLQPDPPDTIIIDEPELGLHPYALSILASLLRSASSRTQIIASTQSVQLVNESRAEDIIVVDRLEDQSTFNRLDEAMLGDWLRSYSLGDLWEKNIIGGRPSE